MLNQPMPATDACNNQVASASCSLCDLVSSSRWEQGSRRSARGRRATGLCWAGLGWTERGGCEGCIRAGRKSVPAARRLAAFVDVCRWRGLLGSALVFVCLRVVCCVLCVCVVYVLCVCLLVCVCCVLRACVLMYVLSFACLCVVFVWCVYI